MNKTDTFLVAVCTFLYILLNHLEVRDFLTTQQNIIAVSALFGCFGLYIAGRWLHIYYKEKTFSYRHLLIFLLCVAIIFIQYNCKLH